MAETEEDCGLLLVAGVACIKWLYGKSQRSGVGRRHLEDGKRTISG